MFSKLFKSKEVESELLTTLKKELADVLDVTPSSIDENANFATLNLDSFNAFNFMSRINSVIEDIPLTVFMECTTLKELENYLIENHTDKIEELIKTSHKE